MAVQVIYKTCNCPTCKKRVIGFEETLESHRV